MKKCILFICLLALAGCGSGNGNESETANTDTYPDKPVEVIVAFSAGGGTDIAARTLFRYAEKYFGQSFAVVNKTGAAGEIGFTALANAPVDGYTIGFINPPTILLHPIQRGDSVKYTLDDFQPIANIVMDPGVIVVRENSPLMNVEDFISQASSQAKDISIGYSGPGTSEARFLTKFEQGYGFELNKVPFDGSAPSVVALLGGHVDSCIMNISEIESQYKEGTVRILAVGSSTRTEMMPDVPTFIEQGYELLQVSYRGVAAPAGMDSAQVQKIESAIQQTLEDPEFRVKAAELQLPLQYMDSEEYLATLREMDDYYRREWETNPW